MLKKDNLLIFCVTCVITAGCKSTSTSPKLKFEPVNSAVYAPNDDYKQALSQWKRYYNHCTSEPLFSNAFYLQLQDQIYIGSINSRQGIDINKGTLLLDTGRHFANVFKLLSIQNAFNCYDTMALVGTLKQSFYNEVIECLNASPGYAGLTTVIDTTKMKVGVSTLYTIELIPAKLIDLLDTTKDTTLIRFKELLLKPGNVLLSETVEVLGFTADFAFKEKLSRERQTQFIKGVYFNLSGSGNNASLILLANNNLRIQFNKRFTVLGKFLQLMDNE
jgi:hypothetical protein